MSAKHIAHNASPHIIPIPFRLACPSLPTMMWSCTAMPSGRAIDFHEGDKVDEAALKTLVRAAVTLNQSKAKR